MSTNRSEPDATPNGFYRKSEISGLPSNSSWAGRPMSGLNNDRKGNSPLLRTPLFKQGPAESQENFSTLRQSLLPMKSLPPCEPARRPGGAGGDLPGAATRLPRGLCQLPHTVPRSLAMDTELDSRKTCKRNTQQVTPLPAVGISCCITLLCIFNPKQVLGLSVGVGGLGEHLLPFAIWTHTHHSLTHGFLYSA